MHSCVVNRLLIIRPCGLETSNTKTSTCNKIKSCHTHADGCYVKKPPQCHKEACRTFAEKCCNNCCEGNGAKSTSNLDLTRYCGESRMRYCMLDFGDSSCNFNNVQQWQQFQLDSNNAEDCEKAHEDGCWYDLDGHKSCDGR